MFGFTFYHSTIKRLTSAFGTLFNDINIERRDATGNVIERIKVPLAYAPKEKFIAKLEQQVRAGAAEVTMPRIGFQIDTITYDPVRKLNTVKKIRKVQTDSGIQSYQFVPVPYSITYTVFVATKNMDDGLQIVEQILPFFTPEYNLVIKEIPTMDLILDVPVVLNGVDHSEEFEGGFQDFRVLTWNLSFTALANIHSPIRQNKVIKTVFTNTFIDGLTDTFSDEQVVTQVDPTTAGPLDDFIIKQTITKPPQS